MSKSDPFKSCGCIYVAFGFDYLLLAAYSDQTLKRDNIGLAVTLVRVCSASQNAAV